MTKIHLVHTINVVPKTQFRKVRKTTFKKSKDRETEHHRDQTALDLSVRPVGLI